MSPIEGEKGPCPTVGRSGLCTPPREMTFPAAQRRPAAPAPRGYLALPDPPLPLTPSGGPTTVDFFEDSLFWRNRYEGEFRTVQAAVGSLQGELAFLRAELGAVRREQRSLASQASTPRAPSEVCTVRLTDGFGAVDWASVRPSESRLAELLTQSNGTVTDAAHCPFLPCSTKTWNQLVPWLAFGQLPEGDTADLGALAGYIGASELGACLATRRDSFSFVERNKDGFFAEICLANWCDRIWVQKAKIQEAVATDFGHFRLELSSEGIFLRVLPDEQKKFVFPVRLRWEVAFTGRGETTIWQQKFTHRFSPNAADTKATGVKFENGPSTTWGFSAGLGEVFRQLRDHPQRWSVDGLRLTWRLAREPEAPVIKTEALGTASAVLGLFGLAAKEIT